MNAGIVLCLAVVAGVAVACESGSNLTEGEQKEFLTDSPAESDSTNTFYASFDDATSRRLENYFEPVLLTRLDQYVLDYTNAATDADFQASYEEGKALFTELYDAFDTPKTNYLKELAAAEEYWAPVSILEELEALNGLLGPIHIGCAAECTELDFFFDLAAMAEKTKDTKGRADDDFIGLVRFIEDGDYGYAGYPGFKVWFVQTWDYGGYSLLGNGVLTDAIKQTMQFDKKNDLFSAQLNEIRQDFVNAMTYDGSFGLSKEEVLKEFEAILELGYFTADELKGINEQREKIQSEAEGYQFNCETGDCSYG